MQETQRIFLENNKVELYIRREDLIHPIVSGNKFRKLKYNIVKAKANNLDTILTFGGAFSNHIAAVAYTGKINGFKTIGIIRGEELKDKIADNPTLKFAQVNEMQLEFISRDEYRNKEKNNFIEKLKEKYGDFYILPEGGTNELAIKGCEEILSESDFIYDYVCCSVGTGGTISGLINASLKHQNVMGFSALKGDFIQKDICKFVGKKNWNIINDYHFGGYGKVSVELIEFMNLFLKKHKILLDPIYTGKMVYGVIDMINKNYFPQNTKILLIHTGGIQGIEGMNNYLKNKNLPLINT